MICESSIKVVSFDIFDTLLVRPALHPKDIFHLVAKKVYAAYGIDFLKMRWDAEERLGAPNATIHDIYGYMAREYGLSHATAQALLAEEIRCEQTLLTPREDVRKLYDEAVRLGKRVIAVSDMYLPSDVLEKFLRKSGYDGIAAVYVSCEHGTRKSDGGLYETVIAAENVHPSEILHIGDDYRSDYVKALEHKITAMHCPSVRELCSYGNSACEALFTGTAGKDPFWNMLMGFSLNRLFSGRAEAPADIADVKDLRHFSHLVAAPLTTGFCLSVATDERLQNTHKNIYFASRDGYLPHKVYAVIRNYVECIPGVYFYAGRRAYYPCLYDSFFEYVDSLQKVSNPYAYTLDDFLKAHFGDTALLASMEAALSEAEKKLLFFRNKPEGIRILKRFSRDIEACMREKRSRIKKYYDAVFDSEEKRFLVFDMGYSGSIGRAVTAIMGRPTDKIYFWEEPENRSADKAYGSTTRLFMKNPGYVPCNLLLEELFSPCEGGVTGFDAAGGPIFEELAATEAHMADMAVVHDCCLEFAAEFCALFGEYAQYVSVQEPDAVMDMCRFLLADAPFCNLRLFRNIVFPDRMHYGETVSLEKKMEKFFPRATVFSGTGFENPNSSIARVPRLQAGHGRLGMHLHLYNIALSNEIIRYLQDFPAPFDLFVTITDGAFARTVQNLFSRAVIPNAGAVTVLPVQNRGRDVAPWVLGMRPYQETYDLFCHIHSKESAHIGFGDEWRKYLFDNVIKADAAAEIINIFTQHPEIGCVFPTIHDKVRDVMIDVGVPLYGSELEYGLICELLRRMGLRGELRRSELFFSVGTMGWYRPRALRQLFTCDLRLEEFAEEPIGVGGTLAHAVERLPALLAVRNGYSAKSFTMHA